MAADANESNNVDSVRNSLRKEIGKFAMSPKLQLRDIEKIGG